MKLFWKYSILIWTWWITR